eukprot:1256737-Rhodomonas_salina.1
MRCAMSGTDLGYAATRKESPSYENFRASALLHTLHLTPYALHPSSNTETPDPRPQTRDSGGDQVLTRAGTKLQEQVRVVIKRLIANGHEKSPTAIMSPDE